MGKQSRKKSSKKGSKEHKAKLQERREKREEYIVNDSNNNNDNNNVNGGNNQNHDNTNNNSNNDENFINGRTILEGDRVWIVSRRKEETIDEDGNDDPGLRRGVVRKIITTESDSDSDDIVHVQPFAFLRVGNDTIWPILKKNLIRDTMNLTTLFDVGDRVVCNSDKGWMPGVVTYKWPVWEYRADRNNNSPIQIPQIPYYEIKTYPSMAGIMDQGPRNVAAPTEDEETIKKYPSVFRFSIGDCVVFDSCKAYFPMETTNCNDNNGWIVGVISDVDVFKQYEYGYYEYGVFECKFEQKGIVRRGKSEKRYGNTCLILKDEDEYITLADNDPRKRLFAAIEQDCSFEHIDYLENEFSIDVSLIQELMVEKAIKSGNFDACVWLEEKQDVVLASLKFPDDNTILHEIAMSPHAFRFFYKFACATFQRRLDDLSLIHNKSRMRISEQLPPPLYRLNKNNDTWFHILRRKEDDLRPLDIAMSQQNGLFWLISSKFSSMFNVTSLFDDLQSYRNNSPDDPIVKLVFDTFLAENKIADAGSGLRFVFDQTEENILNRPCMQDFCAKKFIRFFRQWNNHSICFDCTLTTIMNTIVTKGFSNFFPILLDADRSIINECQIHYFLGFASNDFVQTELYKDNDDKVNYVQLDIVAIAVGGDPPHKPYSLKNHKSALNRYFDFLKDLGEKLSGNILQHDQFSLLSNIQETRDRFKENDRYKEHRVTKDLVDILNYQTSFLEDSDSLPDRIEILNLLMDTKMVRPPNPLDPVKMRQCGILRWMLHQSYLNLDMKVIFDRQLSGTKHGFLGGRRTPDYLSMGTFLCFACVEYDSLHVLSWMVEDQNVTIGECVNGFNFLHLCAYFGRLEIIVWFFTRPEWQAVVSGFSTRKGFEHATAVHVAIMRGHTNAADLLLELGCPSLDENERSPDYFALKSDYPYVHEWGQAKSLPNLMENDVKKLYKLLSKKSYNTAKRFISSSKCLDIERWSEEADIDDATEGTLPSGKTYGNILSHCIDGHPECFVLWLCDEVTRPPFPGHYYQFDLFWGYTSRMRNSMTPDPRSIIDIANEIGDEELIEFVSQPTIQEIKIDDQGERFPPNIPLRFHQRLSSRLIYGKILGALSSKAKDLMKTGVGTDNLQSMALSYRGAARKVSREDEEIFD
jgi:hypothetical protein